MNYDAGSHRRIRPTAALAIMSGIALLAVACGGSPGNSGSSNVAGDKSAGYAAELAYSQCMRSHGVPNFPDPQHNASGTGIAATGVDTSSPQYQSADRACRHLLPDGGTGSSQQGSQDQLSALLRFSRCMRSHEVPDFPDPVVSNGSVTWNINGNQFDPRSPQFQAAQRACQALLPAGSPVPGQGGAPGQGSGS
jgi:hypothetical protein